MSPARPSNREITAKVAQALDAIRLGNMAVGLAHHLSGDLLECLIYDEDELWDKLPKLLQELHVLVNSNPELCYAGTRPPMISEERELDCLELWAYHWDSEVLRMRVYLKFCIEFDRNNQPHYLHARLHLDRP